MSINNQFLRTRTGQILNFSTLDLSTSLSGDIIPSVDNTYTLGNTTNTWKSVNTGNIRGDTTGNLIINSNVYITSTTNATTATTGALRVLGGIGCSGTIITSSSIRSTGSSNQFSIGPEGTPTILNFTTPASQRIYSVPDSGANDQVILGNATQIMANKSFTSRIGIGNLTPACMLHITPLSGTSGIQLDTSTSFAVTTSGSFGINKFTSGDVYMDHGVGSTGGYWFRNNNGGKTLMKIDGGGNVSLGLTSTTYQLDLSADSARKLSSSTWATGCDQRIKGNITNANLDICYQNIKNIPLRRYNYLDSSDISDKNVIGFIAQEIEPIYPKAVKQSQEQGFEDFRTLDTDQLIKCLFGAVQKCMDKIEALEAKNNIV